MYLPGFSLHTDNRTLTFHIIVEEMRNAHKILVATLQGMEDNIKTSITELHMETWKEFY
jgi:hypothetical protein